MRIDTVKLDLCLARAELTDRRLREYVSSNTMQRARRGEELKPPTVGKIARALGVDPAEIVKEVEQ